MTTRNRSAPAIFGAIGRAQAAVDIIREMPAHLDTAVTVGNLEMTDFQRRKIGRLALEFAAKAIELTTALSDLATTQPTER